MAPDATPASRCSSIFAMPFRAHRADGTGDRVGLARARGIHEKSFAATGGVPVPNDRHDGLDVDYQDTDLKDPAPNRSGVKEKR